MSPAARGFCAAPVHAVVLLAALAVAPATFGACQGRPRPAPSGSVPPAASASGSPWLPENTDPGRPHVAELNFENGLPEVYGGGLFGSPKKRSFSDLVKLLGELERGEDDNVRGLVVRLGGGELGFGRAEEIAELLGRIRKRRTPVVCHADELSNAGYWVAASGCDRIWVSPGGSVDTVGIAAQILFGKRLLSSLKVDVDFLQVGKYKGAEEPFTRDEPSEEARESLLSALHGIRNAWLDGIQAGRSQAAREAAELGPYAPAEAVKNGLVDQVGYAGDARADALTQASVEQVVPRFGPRAEHVEPAGLVEVVRVLSGAAVGTDVPHVAVVRATGGITSRPSGSPFSDDGGIAESELRMTAGLRSPSCRASCEGCTRTSPPRRWCCDSIRLVDQLAPAICCGSSSWSCAEPNR
ncbi:MAG: S49 family peptidase [Polyangiaceae bacterium]|nr:S49 family peptidase [Polyangiaceae bacterium]